MRGRPEGMSFFWCSKAAFSLRKLFSFCFSWHKFREGH